VSAERRLNSDEDKQIRRLVVVLSECMLFYADIIVID